MAFTINGRYSFRKDITGEGATSRVLLVDDALRASRPCALKLLRPLGERGLSDARREFETLRSLRHPFIAEVFDFGRVDEVHGRLPGEGDGPAKPGDFFITFSYVNGLDLRDAFLLLFPPGAEPPPGSHEAERRWRTFYESLAEIAIGLHAIHSRGLVHRDIKPQNLLLTPLGPGPVPERFEVKVIDLDLAEPETTPLGARRMGTLPFVAPEILSGEFADPRSDLYSLGISVLWAITGRSPFAGRSVEEVSRAILSGALPDRGALCPTAPAALGEVIARLVRRRSEERISGALELVAELERIGGFSRLARIQGRGDIPTIGWEREMALLASEIDILSRGESARSLMLIESDPSCFTDHLMAEVEAAAQLKGVSFIAGRGRSPALFPYQPISEAIQKLLRRIKFSSPRYDRWREALACFVPCGAAPPAPWPRGSFDLAEEKRRLFDAVSEFLIEAGREVPVILCLRGLERADLDTIEMVSFLARNIALLGRDPEEEVLFAGLGEGGPAAPSVPVPLPPPAGSRLLVIAEHGEMPSPGPLAPGRSAGESPAEALAELSREPWALTIKLRPLPQERLSEWISLRFPGLSPPPKLLQKIGEKCSGSPRLLDEILRRMCRDAGGGEEELESGLKLPDNLLDASLERVHRLCEGDRSLLDLLAAAHAPVELRILSELAEGPPGVDGGEGPPTRPAEVASRLRRLSDEGFLVLEEGPRGLEAGWALEALREHVYRHLPEEKRLHCHRSLLAALLPAPDPPPPGTVPEVEAFHSQRIGDIPGFIRFALAAAEGHRRAHSTEPALRLLDEVLGSLDAIPSAPAEEGGTGGVDKADLRWTVNRDLGEIHRQRRQYPRALEKYAVLLSYDEGGAGHLRRSEVYRRMGEIYCENRDPANALFFLEKSLELVSGIPPSREQVETLIALAQFHLGRSQYQRAESSAERALDVLQRLHAPDLRYRAQSLLAVLAGKQNDHSRSLALNLGVLAEVKGLGDRRHAMEVVGAIGENYVALGEYEKASEHFHRGIEIAQELGAKHALSMFENHLGTIHFNRADHHQALEFFRRSLRLRRELGDLKGIATSYNNLGLVFRLRDDLTRASSCYKKSIDLFARIDDQNGMAVGMNNLANILELEGKYNEALEYSFRSLEKRKRFNSKPGMAFSYYRIGKIYQSKGEMEKALSFAEKGLAIRREIGEKMGIAYSHVQIAELFLLAGKVFEAHQECLLGQREFEQIENDLGRMVAREILARVLVQVGALEEASEIFHDTLARAREGDQELIVGSALMGLSRVGLESGRFGEAEAHLGRAEALFRQNRNRREHAESLLLSCALELEMGQTPRAAKVIEEAYGILEELGIRDLVPWYFLLRGRIERETAGAPPERARKFLERGLVEAREVQLPDLAWQIHLQLALLFSSQGETELARGQAREAEEILDAQLGPLPPELRERFFETRSRGKLKAVLRELEAADPEAPAARPSAASREPAVEGQRQIEEIRSLNRKLQEVSQAITSELELERLLAKLMDAVMDLVKAERGFLILRASEGEKHTITIARNLGGENVERPELKISRTIAQEVMRTARPILTTSALSDERFFDSRSIRDLRLQSILCVPLVLHEQVLGVIYLDNRLRKHAFGEEDLNVLRTFSAQAAIAITNARLSEELKLRNRELTDANRQMEILNQRLLQQVNERTAELEAAREHLEKRHGDPQSSWYFHNLVGRSKRMQEIFHILDRISGTSLPALIQGESGTGKELIANAIHRSSPRHDQRFISENCAALSETILESELFGHTRGAFTGAVAERKGLFELAHGGTLFLDEVGDMSLSMQKKLLRVLEEGEIRRVGGKDTIHVDVRIISASNQDLKSLAKAGKFREDLFYRLNGIRIEIPPLRERKEDIPLLIQHFLEQIAQESRQPLKSISPEALRLLLSYGWPGNVRELRHFLERTMLLATGSCIDERDCLFDQVIFKQESRAVSESFMLDLESLPLRAARSAFMKHYIERVYEENGRNVTRAARVCGISRESLHRLLKKLRMKNAAG